MSIIEIGIKKPVTTLMLALSVFVFSVVILPRIPIELYPKTETGQITVISHLRGGVPASEVEKYVTMPMEEVFAEVNGVKEIISASREAESVITMKFYPGTNLDFAILEIREKLATIRHKLPKEMERPVIARFRQEDAPVVIIALASSNYTVEELREIAEDVLKERLMRIAGVANIEIGGGRERKILIEFDISKLVANNLPLLEIISNINLTNISASAGDIESGNKRILVRATGEYKDVKEIEKTAVAVTEKGSVVYLGDIATVRDSYYEPSSFARLNLSDIVSVYIQKDNTANTLEVAKQIEKEIRVIREIYPKIDFIIVKNDAEYIIKSINSLWVSLIFSAVLVGGILFLFLRSIVSILTVVLTIPISLGFAIILMYIYKLSFNIMTLSGLGLGVGMIVDNAIIIIENIAQHSVLYKNKDKAEVILSATKELFVPILASTLTTIIVFLPLVFLEYQIKQLYIPFGLTITFSLLASLLSSIIFVPWIYFNLSKTFVLEELEWQKKIIKMFCKSIKFVFRKASYILIATAVVIFLSFYILSKRDSEFIETTEINTFRIGVQFPPATKIELSNEIVKKIEKELLQYPQVKRITSRVEKLHTFIEVKVQKDVEYVKEDFRKKFDKFAPAFLYYQPSQEIASKEVFIDFYGHDYKVLKQLAFIASGRLAQISQLSDVKIRMREDEPEVVINIDRNKLSLAGLLTLYFADTLHGKLRGLVATYYRTSGKEIETICRLRPGSVSNVSELNLLRFVSPYGNIYTLNQLSEITKVETQQEIWRKNKRRFIQISANRRVGLSVAGEIINRTLKTINFPKDYSYNISGEYEDMIRNRKQFSLALYLTIVLIYMTLAALLEAYLQPLLIMFSIPTGIVGVSFLLYIFKRPISLGTWIGLMMLCGIVVNAVIVMVEKMNICREKFKKKLIYVVFVSPKTYLREILMTSITTILGILPLIFNFDETAVLWRTLGLTIFGGILFSTVLCLFLVPLLYYNLERISVRS
ncbi:MAG: efflux RND transporter permease subunit [Nitrososphaeria archaeon]